MKLPSGKRLGQSGYELALAVFFTFFIHAAVLAAALFLSLMAVPKKFIPPAYQVKLVSLPQDLAPAPLLPAPVEPAPAPPKPEPVKKPVPPAPKAVKHAAKAVVAAPDKNAIPELSAQKRKPEASEPAVSENAVTQSPAKAATDAAASGAGSEVVAIATPQLGIEFAWYLGPVRNKIGQNWRPPPDAKDAKARVIFTINRSGWVVDVNLDAEHTSGTFGFQQAAIRAIRASNPFPRLPDDYSKKTLQFTVDLMAE